MPVDVLVEPWDKDWFFVHLVSFLFFELSRSSDNVELGRHKHQKEEAEKK
jgi:hypothetical protein